jgi:hypothetical protein
MSNYFFLSGKNPPKVASAFAPEGTKLSQDLIPELDGINNLPFDLGLVKLSIGKNGLIESNDLGDLTEIWLDYQPNSLAWPLMSERLKTTIESQLTGNESIDWITAIIKGNGEQKIYYVPRFNKMLDVLDMQKTMFVQGTDHIIRPVFSISKIGLYSMFSKPSSHNLWRITSGLYVSEAIKKAIQKQKLTGLDFEKTSIS